MHFNVEPYYDDFEENAANNNYVKILFKPGQAVQARELTQIQSILQNQIKQFGDHIFQDGSPVIGGNLTLDNKVKHLKLLETFNNVDVDVTEFENKLIRNSDGTIQAKVLTTYFPTDGTPTLIVRYITGNEFTDGSNVRVAGTTTEAKMLASNSTGPAMVCSINEGVFYVDGYFVKVLDQTTVVNPYDTSANVKIGLEIADDIIDSVIDTTLLDPALGSFNYQAPGADRYQFNLALSTRPLNSAVDESQFFELMRLENGSITKQVKYPVYAELEKTLARRTFDESGDYVVRPFRATLNDGSSADNYVISIEPGKAYVKGFEFETLGTYKIEVPKPRSGADIKSLVDTDVDISYGNFLYVTSLRGSGNGFINIAGLEKVDIHLGKTTCIFADGAGGQAANAFVYANTRIGSAKVKNFVRESSDLFNATVDSNGVYKLYITDINIEPKVLKVTEASPNAQTIVLSTNFCANVNNFINVAVTILPVRLDAVPSVTKANVFVNTYRLNANATGAFTGTVSPGDIVRVADMVRQVVTVDTSGDYLTVNRAWDKTIVATHATTNPLVVYKQQNYTQNVSGQTRIIKSAANNTANLHFTFDRPFDNLGVPDASSVIQFNYGIKDAKSFCSGPVVNNTLSTYANTAFDVSSISTLIDNQTYIEDKIRNTLIFKLPGNFIRRGSLNNADYNHFKLFLDRSNTGTGGQFLISQGQGLGNFETIPWSDTTSAIRDNLIVFVRNNNGNPLYPNGSTLQLTAANVSLSGSPTDTITINTNVPDAIKVDILINVKENNTENLIRKKVLVQNTAATTAPFNYPTTTSPYANVSVSLTNLGGVAEIDAVNGFIWLTNTSYNAVRPGDSISLFVPDVLRIRRILAGNTTHLPDSSNFVDVTNRFLIDYGQKDDKYEHAKLVLKEGFDSVNAKMLVHADFFLHVFATANVSFFSVDSYAQTLYETSSIPIYVSSTGDVYNLRDCLDFRPSPPIGSTTTYNVPNIPGPDETSELSLDYYLPRIDKLVLSKDKEFRVIRGKTAQNPLPPNDLDDAMTLYQINVPAYGPDIRQFRMRYVDNRRLTMKDLANLQKRVENLEYYTSLNNVELLAMSDKTEYADGTEKEKYGIVGENFKNFNIADYKNPEFGVALEGGFMIPSMRTFVLGLKNKTLSSIKKNKRTLSLNYTEIPAITQNVCTSKAVSVQPFLFGAFNGVMELYPETDYWVAETLKPEIISVPERIIEHHHYTREIVKEPAPPITVINQYPVTNIVNQIIVSPGTDLPPTPNPVDVVVVQPPPPPAVIDPIPTPTPPQPPIFQYPPEPPYQGPPDPVEIIERDPWFCRDDLRYIWTDVPVYSIAYGNEFGCRGYSSGMWQKFGAYDDTSTWYPIEVAPAVEPPPPAIIETESPITTQPIVLENTGSGGGGGGGFRDLEFGSYDFFRD